MVVAGLIIGNHGRRHAMSDETRRHVDGFWVLIDEILNALLFALIGLELLVLPLTYIVVLVSILVQELTIGPLVRSLYGSNPVEAGEAH